ncbi:MAG TPA: hypothetical protein VFI91_09335, partial [Longimicrobiaceae bacterium]|nr:hypothetical protein [Longimicrobiaceae bacterium]
MKLSNAIRAGAVSLALGSTLALGACDAIDDMLVVDNPETIQPGELNDERLIDVLANSPPGELQDMYDEQIVWLGSMLTDEVVQGINWEQTARTSQRIIRYNEGDADDMYETIHQLRMISDTVAARLRELVEDPASSAELAQTLVYGGYSYIFA